MKAHLCKCNNCGYILINQNSQIGDKEYELTGKEIEMQYVQGLDQIKKNNFWVCSVCMTADYLVNI